MDEPAVSVKDVVFRYIKNGKRAILDHISLDVSRSAVTVITGASGCGKSTLAAVFCGLYPENGGFLEQGDITVFGEKLSDLSIQKRASLLTMMFQNPGLQFCMNTLRKEMRFCLENLCVPRDRMDELIEEAARKLNVAALLDRRLSELSGGEKQKAALACLFVMNSRCIVLDEAFANIDEAAARDILALIAKLKADGVTIIAVDHRLDLWLPLLDEIIVLGKPDAAEDPAAGARVIARGINAGNVHQYEALFRREGLYFPASGAGHAPSADSTPSAGSTPSADGAGHGAERDPSADGAVSGAGPAPEAGVAAPALVLSDFSVSVQKGRPLITAENEIFPKGQIAAVLGPSGCGKTTAFLAILKQHPYSGTILLESEDLARISRKKLYDRVGIVFQNPGNQFISQNVLEEVCASIRISSRLSGESPDEAAITEKAEKMLQDFDLYRYRKYSPYMLSQGQQRRLAVISVLCGNQHILLLDEPTYGQDYRSTMKIMDLLRNKVRKEGLTVIFITHDRALAEACADSIHEVRDGMFTQRAGASAAAIGAVSGAEGEARSCR